MGVGVGGEEYQLSPFLLRVSETLGTDEVEDGCQTGCPLRTVGSRSLPESTGVPQTRKTYPGFCRVGRSGG